MTLFGACAGHYGEAKEVELNANIGKLISV